MTRARDHFSGRVVFDHLQKTAGRAVNAWLTSVLGTGSVSPNLIGEHRELLRAYGGRYCVVSGHVLFEYGDRPDPRYTYITLLRHPVERALGWLGFLLGNVPVTAATRGLIEGARVFLDTDGGTVSDELLATLRNPYVEHFGRQRLNAPASESETLAAACEAIAAYDVVGCYERMPRFLADVAAVIEADAPGGMAPVNVTSQRLDGAAIGPALRARLESLTELDQVLYRAVLERIDAAGSGDDTSTSDGARRRWTPYEAPSRERSTPWLAVDKTAIRGSEDVVHGSLVSFDVEFILLQPVAELEAGIHVHDHAGRPIVGTNSTLQATALRGLEPGRYRITHHLIADLPFGEYTAGFAFAALHGTMAEPLTWIEAGCNFRVHQRTATPTVGMVAPAVSISLSRIAAIDPDRTVRQPCGSIRAVGLSPDIVQAGSVFEITVEIRNDSDGDWLADDVRPISMSYHWLDERGEIVVREGVRTALPAGGLPHRTSRRLPMRVVAPAMAGVMTLMPTLLQEWVGWFDDMNAGFSTTPHTITINEAPRH